MKLVIASIIVIIILVVSSIIINNRNTAVSVNDFFDDQIDRNDDGLINQEDLPYDWHSYDLGDKVVIRDRIDSLIWDSDANMTILLLAEYTGNYEGGRNRLNVPVPGNMMEYYTIGDYITAEGRMIEYGQDSIYPGEFTIVS